MLILRPSQQRRSWLSAVLTCLLCLSPVIPPVQAAGHLWTQQQEQSLSAGFTVIALSAVGVVVAFPEVLIPSAVGLPLSVIHQKVNASEAEAKRKKPEKLVTLDEFLAEEETARVYQIDSTNEGQRWIIQRSSDDLYIIFDVSGEHLIPADKQPINTNLSVAHEEYGVLLAHEGSVVAFFLNEEGQKRIGRSS